MAKTEAQFLPIRIVLTSPPQGVDYGIQEGIGLKYAVIHKQRSDGSDLVFNLVIPVKHNKEGQIRFSGPHVHGPAEEKFIYINIGSSAGQIDSQWNRRLKVPLRGLSDNVILDATNTQGFYLETRIHGTLKDGSPTCATPKPFNGWKMKKG